MRKLGPRAAERAPPQLRSSSNKNNHRGSSDADSAACTKPGWRWRCSQELALAYQLRQWPISSHPLDRAGAMNENREGVHSGACRTGGTGS
jgi:hypothetical protein